MMIVMTFGSVPASPQPPMDTEKIALLNLIDPMTAERTRNLEKHYPVDKVRICCCSLA